MTLTEAFMAGKNRKRLLLAILVVVVFSMVISMNTFHKVLRRHLEEQEIARVTDLAHAERRVTNLQIRQLGINTGLQGYTDYDEMITPESQALMRRQHGFLMLLRQNGEVLACKGELGMPAADDDFFDYLGKTQFFCRNNLSRVQSDLTIGYENAILYTYGAQKMAGVYLTVEIPGCYLFYSVPYDGVEKNFKVLSRVAYRIWLILLGMFLLILGYMLMDNRRQMNELAEQQKEMRASDARYKLIISRSKNIIIEYDLRKELVVHCENAGVLNTPDMRGTHFLNNLLARGVIFPEDAGVFYNATQRITEEEDGIDLELRLKIDMSGYNWYQLALVCIRDSKGNPWRVVARAANIDQQKREQQQLEQRAVRDPLTKLYNKTATTQEINRILEQEPEAVHAFMITDLDNFKGINDTYGHLLGDQVLTRAAKKLSELFRSSDVLGRIGGDEFVVFCRNVGDEENALQRAQAICTTMKEAGCCENCTIETSASVGLAIATRDGSTFEQLYRNADTALYEAKRGGKGCAWLFNNAGETDSPGILLE
ncbi:MAG: GGDEF domain-containing protein [Angelakisella sp.]